MRRAIFPGSFDPLTNGHLDIIQRSIPLFDEIIIAVLNNPEKKPLFTVKERCEMIAKVLPKTKKCKLVVDSFQGLLVDYAKKKKADAIVRGLRAVADYEYELQMARMNRKLQPNIETVFLMAGEEHSYVSSTLLKQVFTLGKGVSGLVPELIEQKIREKIASRK